MKDVELKLNAYKVLSEIVENGVNVGITNANKFTISPNDQTIKECITSSVMIQLEKYITLK
jgi:hypothetical protein